MLPFPTTEDVDCYVVSFDQHREGLFRGPPTTIGLALYEKRSYMGDLLLGNGDLQLNDLVPGDSGAIEDWIPLTSEKEGTVTFFTRVRVTLRFEIMKIVPKEERKSVGILAGYEE